MIKIFRTLALTIPTSLVITVGLAAGGFDTYYKSVETTFKLFSASMKENTQKALLISKLLEVEYGMSSRHSEVSHSVKVIGSAKGSLRAKEFQSSISHLNNDIPNTFDGANLTYYRDYAENFIVAPKGNSYIFATDKWFDSRCAEIGNCSRVATPYDLRDSIHISPIYEDSSGKGRVITISSPVRTLSNHTNYVTGDVSIDIPVGEFSFITTESLTQFTKTRDTGRLTIMPEGNYIFQTIGFSFHTRLDNMYEVMLHIPIAVYLYQYIPIFITLLLILSLTVDAFFRILEGRTYVESLIERGHTDSMTGALNRHVLLDDAFKNAVRDGGSIIAIDGNNIKGINDQHGHKVGDAAIKAIAESITQSVRGADYNIRLGGDEFLVVLPRCSEVDAISIQRKIEKNLENASFPYAELTVTCGIGVFSDMEELELAMESADHKMYANKVASRPTK